MHTLDEILGNMPEDQSFDLLKLDVQGAELDVLRDGKEKLRKNEVVIAEFSVR